MTLKQIRTTNIQSHKSVTIDLPEKGFVRLDGPNSAGKSVVVKIIKGLMNNDIAKPSVRSSWISKKCSFGEAVYVRSDDVVLTIHITIDASTTWVSLQYPGKEPIVRYLADKNYREFATEFGFHWDEKREFSINIGEGDDAILFYKTSKLTNGAAVSLALTDAQAEMAVENIETTLKEARDMRERSQTAATVISNTLNQIQEYDTATLGNLLDKMEDCFNILSSIYVPTIPDIEAVPNVRSLSIHTPKIPAIVEPRIIDTRAMIIQFPDIKGLVDEIETLKAGTCPTCGRSFA